MKKLFTLFALSLFTLSTFAELAYNATFTQSDFNNSSTVVKKQGTIEWDSDHVRCGGSSNGISIGGPSWNWDDKYFDVKLANGVPDKVTFEWACNNVTSTQADWYVKESADGSNWSAAIWETTSSNSSWTTVTKELQPTTRYLRFCFSGNFAGNFKNIKVTEKILLGTPSPETLDFGTVYVDDAAVAEFTIGWTNLEATVSSSDTHFEASPAAFGAIGLAYQKETISVAMNTQAAGEYSSTISIEGRGKSAQVTVSGVVVKHDQTINWNPAETYNFGDAIPAASATSGLDVNYEISNPSVLAFENGAFRILYSGEVTVTVSQAGNYKYNAATSVVKTIVVSAPTTYGDFVTTTCDEEVVYNKKTYTETTVEDVKVGLNYMGGDSIVHVNVTINHASFSFEEKTIVVGAQETWRGIDLSTYAVGVYDDLNDVITNVAGCDSIITLTLTVTKQPTVELEENLEICAGDSVEYRGVWYAQDTTTVLNIEGELSDTTINVTVTVNPNVYENIETSVLSGHDIELPEGDWVIGEELVSGTYPTVQSGETTTLTFFRYGHTEKGCEDVKELTVTVESNTEAIDNIFVNEKAEKILRNGTLYIRRGDAIFTTTGERVE